jgi:hypothetical protein
MPRPDARAVFLGRDGTLIFGGAAVLAHIVIYLGTTA